MPRFRMLCLLLLPIATVAYAQKPSVARYSANIELRGDGSAHVSASMQFTAPVGSQATLVFRKPSSGSLENLVISDASGKALDTTPHVLVSGTSYKPGSSTAWSAQYDVLPNRGAVDTIPVPVPAAPLLPGHTADITLRFPPDDRLFGDLFPRMTVDGPGQAHAAALGVPSLVLIHWKPAAQITMGESMLTSSNLANAVMLLMLLFALRIVLKKASGGAKLQERQS